jgi:hypothetical protein
MGGACLANAARCGRQHTLRECGGRNRMVLVNGRLGRAAVVGLLAFLTTPPPLSAETQLNEFAAEGPGNKSSSIARYWALSVH